MTKTLNDMILEEFGDVKAIQAITGTKSYATAYLWFYERVKKPPSIPNNILVKLKEKCSPQLAENIDKYLLSAKRSGDIL